MKRRGEGRDLRRGEGRHTRRVSAGHARRARRGLRVLAVALVALAAAGAASCGGLASADLGACTGTWQRVEAGAPDPDFTLTIVAQGDGASLTFANRSNGTSQTVAGTVEDGYLACTLPNAGGETAATAAPGVPAESKLQLSLDDNGQLVVDLVLADGTLEPIWIYERAAAAGSPSP